MDKATTTAEASELPKVLAVASFGGHLVQLARIIEPLRQRCRVVYVYTSEKAENEAFASGTHYVVREYSRDNPWRILSSLVSLFKIMRRERPKAVVSTGAAPGLSSIIIGRLLGIRTLWIDSVANAEQLSLCGKIARKIAHRTLSQWPHLAKDGVEYHGNTL